MLIGYLINTLCALALAIAIICILHLDKQPCLPFLLGFPLLVLPALFFLFFLVRLLLVDVVQHRLNASRCILIISGDDVWRELSGR